MRYKIKDNHRYVICQKCGKQKGYYENTGKNYLFKCLHCGYKTTNDGDTITHGVLEVHNVDKSIDYVILNKSRTPRELISIIGRYKILVIKAIYRKPIHGVVVERVLIGETMIRTWLARTVSALMGILNSFSSGVQSG